MLVNSTRSISTCKRFNFYARLSKTWYPSRDRRKWKIEDNERKRKIVRRKRVKVFTSEWMNERVCMYRRKKSGKGRARGGGEREREIVTDLERISQTIFGHGGRKLTGLPGYKRTEWKCSGQESRIDFSWYAPWWYLGACPPVGTKCNLVRNNPLDPPVSPLSLSLSLSLFFPRPLTRPVHSCRLEEEDI